MATMLQPDVERGEAYILDSTGDTRITWDRDNAEEVAAARETFNRLTKDRKYSAFVAEGKKGKKQGERLTAFDPAVERMIFVPQYAGG